MDEHPMQILIRCDRPSLVAALIFGQDSVVEAKLHADGGGLLVATRNADRFYQLFNRIVLDNNIAVEAVAPADENVHSVYEYLIGGAKGAAS
jgi:ABC-2 type transport system ATP-binding protein